MCETNGFFLPSIDHTIMRLSAFSLRYNIGTLHGFRSIVLPIELSRCLFLMRYICIYTLYVPTGICTVNRSIILVCK